MISIFFNHLYLTFITFLKYCRHGYFCPFLQTTSILISPQYTLSCNNIFWHKKLKPICLCNVNLVELIKHINISTNVSTVLFKSYLFDCMEQQFTTQQHNENTIDIVLERC